MKKLKLTRERKQVFLRALGDTGIVSVAVEIAGTSRTRVYELRKHDASFAKAWEEAEEQAADALEAAAWRRTVDGISEPLVVMGKLIRDENDQPVTIQKYSDNLLIALLRARRPERFRDRTSVELDISDKLADRLKGARRRALANPESPATLELKADEVRE